MFRSAYGIAGWLLTIAICLSSATQVQAQREREAPRREVRGVVKSVDGAKSITIAVGAESREAATAEQNYALAKNVEVVVGSGGPGGRGGLFKEVKLTDLAPGNRVSLSLAADEKSVESVVAEGATIRGQLKAVDAAKKTVIIVMGGGRERPGEEKELSVADNAEIAVDEGRGRRFSAREAKLGDLAAGALVTAWLSLDGKQVHAAVAEGPTHFGTIKAVDAAKKTVTLITRPGRGDDPAEEQSLTVAEDAVILLDDGRGRRLSVKEAKLANVMVGAAANARLSVDQNFVMMLRVEGPSVFGALKAVDADKGTLVIAIFKSREDVEEKSFTLAKDARVFLDGTETKLGNLNVGDGRTMVQVRLGLDQKTALLVQARQGRERER